MTDKKKAQRTAAQPVDIDDLIYDALNHSGLHSPTASGRIRATADRRDLENWARANPNQVTPRIERALRTDSRAVGRRPRGFSPD